jgi:hypothetical protein
MNELHQNRVRALIPRRNTAYTQAKGLYAEQSYPLLVFPAEKGRRTTESRSRHDGAQGVLLRP